MVNLLKLKQIDMTKINFLPSKKVSNWNELPFWVKSILPFISLILVLVGIFSKLSIVKDIGMGVLYFNALLSYLHYTHETRKKTIRKAIVILIVSGLIISIAVIYILTSK